MTITGKARLAGVLGWPIIKIGIFGILANLTGAIGAGPSAAGA